MTEQLIQLLLIGRHWASKLTVTCLVEVKTANKFELSGYLFNVLCLIYY